MYLSLFYFPLFLLELLNYSTNPFPFVSPHFKNLSAIAMLLPVLLVLHRQTVLYSFAHIVRPRRNLVSGIKNTRASLFLKFNKRRYHLLSVIYREFASLIYL